MVKFRLDCLSIIVTVMMISMIMARNTEKKHSKQISYLAHQYSCLNATCIASCHK